MYKGSKVGEMDGADEMPLDILYCIVILSFLYKLRDLSDATLSSSAKTRLDEAVRQGKSPAKELYISAICMTDTLYKVTRLESWSEMAAFAA